MNTATDLAQSRPDASQDLGQAPASPPQPVRFQPPTIDTLSPSQIASIRQIPPLDQFVAPVIDARRPVSIFLGEERFGEEQAKLFRKLPVAVTMSAMLREPGSVLRNDSYGVPLLLTRDKAGTVRAFLNACKHKGAMLVETCKAVKAARVTCPYHAWTYALDGKLIGVPRQETFAALDKAERGLTELPALEAGGIIYAILDPAADPDFSSVEPQLTEDFEHLGLPGAHVYGHQSFNLDANWKLVLEPFLEPYHVQRLHAESVGMLSSDGVNVVDFFGDSIRQVAGKSDFAIENTTAPGRNIHNVVTFSYIGFPALVVITSPYYISVMIIAPRAANKTRVEYFMTVAREPDSPKAEEIAARSYEMILHVFGNEDFRAAQLCHAGLASGALAEVIYAGMEKQVVDYHEILEAALAR